MKIEPLKTYDNLDQFIGEQSAAGWQVISRTDNAVQMKRGKQWSRLGLILGTLGLLLYGAGLIIMLLTVIDYLFQKEQIGYVTTAQLRSGDVPGIFSESDGSCLHSVLAWLLIIGAVALVIALLTQ